MDINLDCFHCILQQIIPLAKSAAASESERRAMVRRMLRIVADTESAATPPDVAAAFRREERTVSGVMDNFLKEKDLSTALGLQLLPEMRALVKESPSPFAMAVRLAIGGNIIDFGADPQFNLDTAEHRIREVVDMELSEEALRRLEAKMTAAKSIFYILDNCGEAVLDRLLLERFADKITVGVRGFPILNDVTPREAKMSGIDFVPIVDTGDMTPGVSLLNSSERFVNAMRNSDLVIAKGQGNYETLNNYDRPIAFLLRVKCLVIAGMLNQPLHSLQILLHNME